MDDKRLKIKNTWIVPAAIWWVIAAFLLFAVAYPILTLFINSFTSGGSFSLENYKKVFESASILTSVGNSFKVVIPATVFSTAIGVFLAWVVVRTDVPGRKLFRILLSVPYFIPPFIGAISWTYLIGPKGFFNTFLMNILGSSEPVFNVYSIGGMIFVMTMFRFAVPFIVVMPTMEKISSSVEEAARISGASPWRTLRDITLPLLGPSIFGSMLLVFMFLLEDFGVSAVLGAPNQIRLMTTEIYYLINRPDLENHLQIAAAASMFLSIIALLGLFAYNRVLSKNKYAVVSGKSTSAEPVLLGKKAKALLLILLIAVFIVTTCSPVIASVITSLTKAYGQPFGPGNITMANFVKLGTIRNIGRAFRNSFILAFSSAAIITMITLIIAYMAIRKNIRGAKGAGAMQVMVTLPYALPGTIIALGMILAFARPLPLTGIKLYGTFSILLIAYVARFLNLGYNNIAGAISQIDISLEEAARISGAGGIKVFRSIIMPILKPSLISSFFLVAAPTLAEISLSSLLWSVGNETIGTVIYSAQEEGKVLRSASLAVVLIIVIVLINFLARTVTEGRTRNRYKRS